MSDAYFLGIDSGSQSTKVALIDQSGHVVCSASQPLQPMLHRKPGWVEHPDDDLWESLKAALQALFARFHGSNANIVGIGLCAIRCCRVFLHADGSLAAPVMSWMDVRAYEPYEDAPDIAYTGSTSGYLTFRLTGEFKDSIANAFQSQFPVDMHNWQWADDPEFVGSYRIPRAKLFEVKPPGTILGRVTDTAAKETGLPAGVPVVATANDKAVEALGSGLLQPNEGLLSLGTYITSMVTGSVYREDSTHFFTNLSSVPYRYLYESHGIRGGMGHISWFKGMLGPEIAAEAEKNGQSVEQLLEKEARQTPAGAEGLLIVPDWLAPATQLYRKGVMLGFDQRHTRGHIHRAFMEAIAMRMENAFTAMCNDLQRRPERLIVCGGGAKSDLFLGIVADVFGLPAVRTTVTGAAGVGAAISAAVATGYYADYESAVAHMVHEETVFVPDAKRQALYTRINKNAYQHLTAMLQETLRTVHTAYGFAE
ncbi:MAG: FGGY family carbohydrate kinase [Desulfohalobium sp.]